MHSEMFVFLPVFEGCFQLVFPRYFDCLQRLGLLTRKYVFSGCLDNLLCFGNKYCFSNFLN